MGQGYQKIVRDDKKFFSICFCNERCCFIILVTVRAYGIIFEQKFSNEIVKSFEMFGNLLIHKYSLDLQTLGNFELDIDMKPGTWIYISRFENRNTLKINDSSQDISLLEKKFFVENGLLNF